MIRPGKISLAISLGVLLAQPGARALAERYDGNLRPEVRTEQDDINAGTVPLDVLFYRGMHIYTNRFTTTDGYSEAPDGPRRKKLSLAENPLTPFLRFNGLDAQSCFECHSALGFRESNGFSVPREPGSIGSSAGFSANVFIFENPDDLRNGLVRNPPHTFGLGYIQRLAQEMTEDILDTTYGARDAARASGDAVRVELVSKGVRFGYLTVLPTGAMDRSEIEGISIDLVVRPFQFKGVASSIRNFVAGAMNFHFAVQPKELLDRAFILDDNPSGMLKSDKLNEIMEGDVSAVAIFLAALRPPMVDTTGLDAAAVSRGRALMDSVGCSACHVPTLRLEDSTVTIADPRFLRDLEYSHEPEPEFRSLRAAKITGLPQMVAEEVHSEFLAPVVEYEWKRDRSQFKKLTSEKEHYRPHPPGYTLDLNSTAMPDEAMPRLPNNADGSVDVPLFSDLRRHRMGDNLKDRVPQRTEMQSITAPADEFVTRPLWGVADTGPWLHDGRATTLREAILLHAGPGSEANEAVGNFEALLPDDQEAMVEFLRSLRVRPMPFAAEPLVLHREGFVTQ